MEQQDWLLVSQGFYTVVQLITVHCGAVKITSVQYIELLNSLLQYIAFQFCAARCSAVM